MGRGVGHRMDEINIKITRETERKYKLIRYERSEKIGENDETIQNADELSVKGNRGQ